MLNIVLVRAVSKVEGLQSLVDFVDRTRKSGKFSKHEPHVFLFAENHFQTNPAFKTQHHENKPLVRALVKALEGTEWHVAFAANEKYNRNVSNTGYFVSPTGYSALPKRLVPPGDEGNIRHESQISKRGADELKGHWDVRTDELNKREFGRNFKQAEIGGHTVEFRVCADAREEKPANPNCLTLVSAEGLGKLKEHAQREIRARRSPFRLGNEIDDGIDVGTLPKTRGTVVVNDSISGLSLILGEKKFDLLEQLKEANEALKPKGISVDWHYF